MLKGYDHAFGITGKTFEALISMIFFFTFIKSVFFLFFFVFFITLAVLELAL